MASASFSATTSRKRIPARQTSMIAFLRTMAIVGGLGFITSLALWPVIGCGFIGMDDSAYVTHNPQVLSGVSVANARWFLTHTHEYLYHPLSLITFMFDHAAYGLHPAGYHAVNLAFHIANAVLLFLLLRSMTGHEWRAAAAAAIFAVHPLRVESVAWVSERKDVLAMFFALLALIAYVRFARTRDNAERRTRSLATPWIWYGLVMLLLVLSLLAKPALVTFPFLALILDFWPLGRLKLSGLKLREFSRLVLEKVPLFVVIVFLVILGRGFPDSQPIAAENAVDTPVDATSDRVITAPITTVRYLFHHVYLTGLAIPYPIPANGWPGWQSALSLLFLAGITIGVIVLWRRVPWLLAGWAWFAVAIGPFVGIIYIADYAMADRYTYLADIGLLLAVLWSIPDRWTAAIAGRAMVAGVICAVLGVLIIFSRVQAAYWRNDATLFGHTVAVTEGNARAYWHLAKEAAGRHDHQGAVSYYMEAQKYASDEQICTDMGEEFARAREYDNAIHACRIAIAINPRFPKAHYTLGLVLKQAGDANGAGNEFHKAVELAPRFALAKRQIEALTAEEGPPLPSTIRDCRAALAANPNDSAILARLHARIAELSDDSGDSQAAIAEYREAIRLNPSLTLGHINLGFDLESKGRLDDAVEQYRIALALSPYDADAHYNLGAALAKLGRKSEAAAEISRGEFLRPRSPDEMPR